MNRTALQLFARLKRRRRLIGRLLVGGTLVLAVLLALDIYFRLIPETRAMTRAIQDGSQTVADLDLIKRRAIELERAFDRQAFERAERRVFDDVDSVSAFINALTESLKSAGFFVNTHVAPLRDESFDGEQRYGRPIRLIALDLTIRNPRVRPDTHERLLEVLRRIPDLGRKADLVSLRIEGSGADLASASMRFLLWSSFRYEPR